MMPELKSDQTHDVSAMCIEKETLGQWVKVRAMATTTTRDLMTQKRYL